MMHLVPSALLIALFWAVGGIVQKVIIQSLSPETSMAIIGAAYALIVVVYGIYNRATVVPAALTLSLRQWAGVAFVAIGSIFYANLWLYRLLERHAAYKVTALTYVSPVFTLVLAAMLLGEKVTPVSIAGVLLIVLGVVMVAA